MVLSNGQLWRVYCVGSRALEPNTMNVICQFEHRFPSELPMLTPISLLQMLTSILLMLTTITTKSILLDALASVDSI